MSNVDSQKIISVLKSEIENYDNEAKTEEVGRILSVGDGIATIYGLQHAKYGELLEFENGTEGMVLNLEQKTVGCVLFGNAERSGGRFHCQVHRPRGWRRRGR